ncbi:hypothetical protein BP00DRAFT_36867 [Aspergillus indologenus CBS 114.80]|uniref:Uncharacterized protein n=1 Tax=Aspergillus indologenus CBS 114.80 TaxID=1450541 RepID=A0A2V5J1D5_9EURO|nr:hypothetical protein BP00DRAFT_36867 [Aspergillus indologenus CBS 114.80]
MCPELGSGSAHEVFPIEAHRQKYAWAPPDDFPGKAQRYRHSHDYSFHHPHDNRYWYRRKYTRGLVHAPAADLERRRTCASLGPTKPLRVRLSMGPPPRVHQKAPVNFDFDKMLDNLVGSCGCCQVFFFFRGGELRLLRGKTERIRNRPNVLNPECRNPLVDIV